jgi:hypothetical protein
MHKIHWTKRGVDLMSCLVSLIRSAKGKLLLGFGIVICSSSTQAIDPALCTYNPQDSLFKAGQTVVEQFIVAPGPGSTEAWRVWLPNVKEVVTSYDQIPLHSGDRIRLEACGCVQTGGHGSTWKRYVNPSGNKSGGLYHGLLSIDQSTLSPLTVRHKKLKDGVILNLVRIQDLMKAQADASFFVPILAQQSLTLGYEDDGYSDNGYWGHDNGTGDQCKNIGGAVVEVRVKHP